MARRDLKGSFCFRLILLSQISGTITKQPGLETAVFFRLPRRTILSIVEKHSKITLTTNEGNSLSLEELFDGYFQIVVNENPSEATITLRSAELPAKSTSNFLIDGTFILITGADLKTVDVDLKLVEGTKIKFGPAQLSVNQIGPAFEGTLSSSHSNSVVPNQPIRSKRSNFFTIRTR